MTPLNLEKLRAYRVPSARDSYDARDAILYALGTGAGLTDAVDETDLVFERRLKVLPTLALVLGTPGFWLMDPKAGIDWLHVLHGEQSLRLYRPLEPNGELIGETRIGEVGDKRPGKPALFHAYRTLKTPGGSLVAELSELWVVRGAGGFGGERALPQQRPVTMPNRAPDAVLDLPTSPQQAMLYRLSGDRNPLHVDPETARKAGFERPILHGLSTMGLVGRALVHLCCGGDPDRLSSLSVRFTAPVLPGDNIRTEIWREGDEILFRARVPERQEIVIDGGVATIDAFARVGGDTE